MSSQVAATGDEALLSGKQLSTRLPMGHSERIPCCVLLALMAFAFPVSCHYLGLQVFSLLLFLSSSPTGGGGGKRVKSCVVLSCLPGLIHDISLQHVAKPFGFFSDLCISHD